MVSQDMIKEILNQNQGLMGQFTGGFAKKWFGSGHGVSLMFAPLSGNFPRGEGRMDLCRVSYLQRKSSENSYRLPYIPYPLRFLLLRPL